MYSDENKTLRVAILDLYEGQPNQGMRCIKEILDQYRNRTGIELMWEVFEVRGEKQLPDLSFDVYISSGGPGSPLASEGLDWEVLYFSWLEKVLGWNRNETEGLRKHVFFICHSYQLACRYFSIGNVCKRKSTAFGVFPVHMLPEAVGEPVFEGLREPFYGVDSRDFQVIEPDYQAIRQMGATVLAIEKDRPHVPFQRAVMAVRFNEYMVGTQFHPEADALGMSMYLQREDKKQTVIAEHGEAKWESMITHLNDPDKILWTYSHILPNFLDRAVEQTGKNSRQKKVG